MTQKLLNQYENEYSTNAFIQFEAAEKLVEFAQPIIPPATNILDVGCGSGKVSQYIFQSLKANSLHGIDQAHAMIEMAMKSTDDPDISYSQVAIESFSSSKKYDFIFSNSSFQWFSDYNQALASIQNCLTNSGYFFIQSSYKQRWCPEFLDIIESLKEKHAYINDLMSNHHFPCMHLENKSDYEHFLSRHGFLTKKIKTHDFVYTLSPEKVMQVFNSGPVKAYTSSQFYNEDTCAKSIEMFYSAFQKEVINYHSHTVTYPRIFIQCQVR